MLRTTRGVIKMNRRQTKKELKKVLASAAKQRDLQTAWEVVAEHLIKDNEVCYFVETNWNRSIIRVCTGGNNNRDVLVYRR